MTDKDNEKDKDIKDKDIEDNQDYHRLGDIDGLNSTEKDAQLTSNAGNENMGKEEHKDAWTEAPEVKDEPTTKLSKKQSEEDWERDVLNRLAFASLNEQRRSRRWGIFFKVLAFIYIGALLFYMFSQ